MAVEIGSAYKENLYRFKGLALLAIANSKDSSLTHIITNREEGLTAVVRPCKIKARCYECHQHIKKGVSVALLYDYGIIEQESYFFHDFHLFSNF